MHSDYNLLERTLFLLVLFLCCINGEFDCPRTVVQCKTHCVKQGFGHAKCLGRKCKCYFERKLPDEPDIERGLRKPPVMLKPASTCHLLRLNIVSYIKCIASLYPKTYNYLFSGRSRMTSVNDKTSSYVGKLFPSNVELFPEKEIFPNFDKAKASP